MEQLWTEPGSGFSDDWLGFHRSVEKRASGRFYAQCKYCTSVMDGRLPNLRKHKLECSEFNSAHMGVAPVEAFYETAELVEDQGDYDGDSGEELVKEVLKQKKKRKKPRLVYASGTPRVLDDVRQLKSPQYTREAAHHGGGGAATATSGVAVHSSPVSAAEKTRFTDTARVWERKLCDLPLAQALQIEKTVNDLLYEATLANIQYQQQPQPMTVTIKAATQEDE